MNKRRIFIAINLPETIRKKLLEIQKQWANLPVRWTKENNLHLTLVFIGYVDNEQLLEICLLTKEAGKNHQPFEIKFRRVCLGPPHQPARLIWIEGEKNPQLAQLRNDLEQALFKSAQSSYYQPEKKDFHPHLTLARIRQHEWRTWPNKPIIDQDVNLIFPVHSIEVMESELSRQGAEYIILESVKLGE